MNHPNIWWWPTKWSKKERQPNSYVWVWVRKKWSWYETAVAAAGKNQVASASGDGTFHQQFTLWVQMVDRQLWCWWTTPICNARPVMAGMVESTATPSPKCCVCTVHGALLSESVCGACVCACVVGVFAVGTHSLWYVYVAVMCSIACCTAGQCGIVRCNHCRWPLNCMAVAFNTFLI